MVVSSVIQRATVGVACRWRDASCAVMKHRKISSAKVSQSRAHMIASEKLWIVSASSATEPPASTIATWKAAVGSRITRESLPPRCLDRLPGPYPTPRYRSRGCGELRRAQLCVLRQILAIAGEIVIEDLSRNADIRNNGVQEQALQGFFAAAFNS